MRGGTHPSAPVGGALKDSFGVLFEDSRDLLPAGAAYGGTLLLLPWLPVAAVLCAAAVAAAALGLAWYRSGLARSPIYVVGLWSVLHPLLLASGGLSSPLLPTVGAWLVLGALVGGFHLTIGLGIGAATLLGLADGWHGPIAPDELIEGSLVILSGGFAGWLLERGRRAATEKERVLRSIHDEVARGRKSEEAEAATRVGELNAAVERVREAVDARRVVLWNVDADGIRARPHITRGGKPPASVHLRGDPLLWAWEEAMPLRLDDPPPWAGDATRVCIVPLEPKSHENALLTLDFEPDQPFPSTRVLDEEAAQLRAYLTLQTQQAYNVAAQERLRLLGEVLERLPREIEAEAVASELARSAVQISGASGAVVASWDDGVGRILAVVGDGDFSDGGATFRRLESEMAVAAETTSTIEKVRPRADRHALPLAAPGERWNFEPRSIVVVPLNAPGQGISGVLALWQTHTGPFEREVINFFKRLAPFAALQLRQGRELDYLRTHAERDPLTGLPNRRAFDARLEAESEGYRDGEQSLALLVLDIDHFKATNDRYGHEAGDAVLSAIGELLQTSVRDADLAARYGGEEFVVLLPKTDLAMATEIAERIRLRVEASPVVWNDARIDVRVSIGIAAAPESVDQPDKLFENADAALYEAKETGRNRVVTA